MEAEGREQEEELLRAVARQRPATKGAGKVGPWGRLVLTSRHLVFAERRAGEDYAEVLRVRLSDVASHATTPPTAKLVCLKITTDDAGAHDDEQEKETMKKRKCSGPGTWVFEFESGALGERDGFRDLIAQLVPPLRRLKRPKASHDPRGPEKTTAQPAPTNSASVVEQEASPEVAKKREALLESSREVRELYERLVLSGTITAQEFWQSRETMMDTESQRLSQKPVDDQAREESGELKPVVESDTSVQYRLTAADIRTIFTEQPAVKKAFEEWVPHKMSEVQFWTKYFQSKYFHRGAKSQEPSEVSQEQAAPDAAKSSKRTKQKELKPMNPGDLRRAMAKVDLSSDLTRRDEVDAQVGYGVVGEDTKPKNTKKLSLLQKINQHGTHALGEIEKSMPGKDGDSTAMDIDISSSSLTAKDPITKSSAALSVAVLKASEAKLAEATLLPELEGKEDANYVALAIQDYRSYFQDVSLVPVDVPDSATSTTSIRQGTLSTSFRSEVESVRRNSEQRRSVPLVDARTAADVMHELDSMCRTANRASQSTGSFGLSAGEMKMLLDYHDRAQELLRHFWRCYPLTSRALVTKVTNVAKAIEELKEEMEAVASKKRAKALNRTVSGVAEEVLLSVLRSLTKALDMRASQRTHL